MTINDEVRMPPSDPYGRLGCTLRRIPSYALHVRVEPQLDTSTMSDTVRALAAQLVLVPRFVVLETGELLDVRRATRWRSATSPHLSGEPESSCVSSCLRTAVSPTDCCRWAYCPLMDFFTVWTPP